MMAMLNNRKFNKGFTLVELAIVIVIIGIIVGGVLQGQSLVEQAKVKSQISQIQEYNAAVNTFKAKYNAIPGDMINAVTMGLGTSGGAGDNGDGNGEVNYFNIANPAQSKEAINFWYHLSQAEIIKFIAPGYVNGVTFATRDSIKTSMPVGAFPGLMVVATSFKSGLDSNWCSSCITAAIDAGQGYMLVNLDSVGTQWAKGSLSPNISEQIDRKYDDGLLFSGNISCGGNDRTATAFFSGVSNQCGWDKCETAVGSNTYRRSDNSGCNLAIGRQF